ncbi:uncharacterized protein N7459_008926 [Penicillium hispanicum]|uniref:uncharacterized protein n=1 Tax=Penicillium hispanicum TaxID=1080232 RepID=UPI00254046A5|nr:uncharacterized protein N7459_008926 [Penicillium hispanicum]KAJ5569496.1 hypothetical protein N7459_008926 [Penicillium hispanicum]
MALSISDRRAVHDFSTGDRQPVQSHPVDPPFVAFISGPADTGPGQAYFHTYYASRIDSAIAREDHFVIGSMPHGTDADAVTYLLAHAVPPTHITVCMTPAEDQAQGKRIRALQVNALIVPGGTRAGRDATMTALSDYDILRVRTPQEAREVYGARWQAGYITNTERNWKRRRGIAEGLTVDADKINLSVGSSAVVEQEAVSIQPTRPRNMQAMTSCSQLEHSLDRGGKKGQPGMDRGRFSVFQKVRAGGNLARTVSPDMASS